MKKFLRCLFSCILSLFLAISLLAGGACYFVQNNISNPSALNSAANADFTQELYDEIVYDWENLLSITGVTEPETIMSVLTYAQVEKDALDYLAGAFNGGISTDTQALRTNLDEKVRQYAYSHNIHATPEEELEQNIKDLVNACIADYEDAIRIPLLPTTLGYAAKIGPYCTKLLPIIAAGALVLFLFLLLLQRKKQDVFYYSAISAATGGIVLIGAVMAVEYYEIIGRLPFSDSAIKTLVVNYCRQLLAALQQYGYLYLMGAGACLVLYLVFNLIAMLFRKPKTIATE